MPGERIDTCQGRQCGIAALARMALKYRSGMRGHDGT